MKLNSGRGAAEKRDISVAGDRDPGLSLRSSMADTG
jgi:hypothetical protein